MRFADTFLVGSATIGLLGACTNPVAPPVPDALTVVRGVPEISVPGQRFDTIRVQLSDGRGQGVAGWPVTWTGDGEVVPLDSITDPSGAASAVWTLPRYPHFNEHSSGGGASGRHALTVEAIGAESVTLSTESRAFVVVEFDASSGYACGTKAGELWCWGGTFRVFGGNVRDVIPRRVTLPPGVTAVDVVTGEADLCILDAQGQPWCTSRESGRVFQAVSGVPPLGELSGASAPSGRSFSMCGLAQADGMPWCWDIENGTLGAPARRGTIAFTSIDLGADFGCGLDGGGLAWCWGSNAHGQLGNGGGPDSVEPVPVSGGQHFVTLAVGRLGACGAVPGTAVYCWGWGPNEPPTNVPVPVAAPGIVGPDIFLDGTGQGYAIVGEQLRIWYGDTPLSLFWFAGMLHVRRVAGGGQICVQGVAGDVWCSWILVKGGGDTSPFPSDLVPVPDPHSKLVP